MSKINYSNMVPATQDHPSMAAKKIDERLIISYKEYLENLKCSVKQTCILYPIFYLVKDMGFTEIR